MCGGSYHDRATTRIPNRGRLQRPHHADIPGADAYDDLPTMYYPLRADRTGIGNCYRCGYEDYSAEMRLAPSMTPGSSMAGYKKDAQPTGMSPPRYYPPRGLTVVATMDGAREKAKAKRLERRHQ